LLVLTLEEQSDFGACVCCGGIAVYAIRMRSGFASHIRSSRRTALGLWCGGDSVQSLTCDRRSTMDVFLDAFVSCLYRGAVDRRAR